jgi:putative transposase
VKYAWIKNHHRMFAVKIMCRVLQVSASGFYAWLKRPLSVRRQRRDDLAGKIRQVNGDCRCYGSPRVHRTLLAAGERVCENTIARIMAAEGIRARQSRKFVPRTTDSTHNYQPAKNLLNRCFDADRPNTRWAADITYVWTDEGWLYLAAVIDLCSRRIVGWSMADHMKVQLVGDALQMACARRNPEPGLLHHSDRGVQYACDDYQALLDRHGMQCSMSGKGDCYDNAVMESFWSSLKIERVYQEHYETHEQARASIFEYIEVFYNRKRLHSSLGYVSPEAFEAALN